MIARTIEQRIKARVVIAQLATVLTKLNLADLHLTIRLYRNIVEKR